MQSYTTDLVPLIAPCLGGSAAAHDLAGIICQFRGYTCENRAFMQFRACFMTRVFKAQASGASGVTLYHSSYRLPSPELEDRFRQLRFIQTYVLWLMVDFENLGYIVEPFEDGPGFNCICKVRWEQSCCGMFGLAHSDQSDGSDYEFSD